MLSHSPYIRIYKMAACIHILAFRTVHSCGMRDVTSPLPPPGNEGYIHNQDVPFQSVMFDITSTMMLGVPMESATTRTVLQKLKVQVLTNKCHHWAEASR